MSNIFVAGIYDGLPYVITKNSLGIPCGYVGLSTDHPWANDDDIDCVCHGGITYNDYNKPFDWKKEKVKTCETRNGRLLFHIINGYKFWVGFDCGHAGDDMPMLMASGRKWSNREMVDECKKIIDQANNADGIINKVVNFLLTINSICGILKL